jgi:hypothetical protein
MIWFSFQISLKQKTNKTEWEVLLWFAKGAGWLLIAPFSCVVVVFLATVQVLVHQV